MHRDWSAEQYGGDNYYPNAYRLRCITCSTASPNEAIVLGKQLHFGLKSQATLWAHETLTESFVVQSNTEFHIPNEHCVCAVHHKLQIQNSF